jgi:CubicO group peptidase (beta-lactamase class C family)
MMPKLSRRKALHLTLAGAAALTAPRLLRAQDPPPEPSEIEALIAKIEGPQSPDRKNPDPQKLAPLTLPEVMKKLGVPGVSVAVIKNFQIHWAKGYGLADVESGAPVDTHTLFQAASISKPITAMAFLKATTQGRLSLDADVNTMLKSWQVPTSDLTKDSPVTPRSLFSHTSGSDDGFGFPGYAPDKPLPTLVQILKGEKPSNVGAVRFERPPFAAFKYSGGGTVIMQLAMTETLDKPFAQIMQELVLDPLEMKDSTFEQPFPAAREAAAARAHNGLGKPMGPKWHVYPEQAAAGLWTTPSDLAKCAIEIQEALRGRNRPVLTQSLAREMITPTGVGPCAVGMMVEKRGEGWYFQHGGGNWGFSCVLTGHIRKGYGLAIMTNGTSGGHAVNEVATRIATAYNWDAQSQPLPR